MVSKVGAECQCSECSFEKRGLVKQGSLKPGCLRRLAVEEALLLLAHGVADGFCVDTASSVCDTTQIVEGTATLLLELIEDGKVMWDTWFTVASCVYLGCPFQRPVEPTHPAFGGTAFAAIQYGDLAAQAPWLDLTRELSARGCFRIVGSRGRLGVVTRRYDDIQFRSVEENFAIIETENTEDTSPFCSRYKKAVSPVDHGLSVDEDESSVKTDVILCQVDDKFYRLSSRIQTKNHWRIVDPSDALSAVIRINPSTTCQHGGQAPVIAPLNAKIYTMDEVVGWPDVIRNSTGTTGGGRATKSGIFHLTHVLDTHLKKNIALALSVCPVAVPNYPDISCTTCMLDHAGKVERKPYREGEGGDPAPTLFAIGHHLFYLNLDGKEAISQSLMLRYGTVIAFCSKASLGTAVTMAFHQRAWRVVRYKTARLKTIDSIFTANSDIFSLVTWGSIKKAKIGTLLAIYCWVTL
ncbi:hypothetical protein H9L39_18298 [Fusarium oxysporum f. sp. albedinis]|nr:hypothetical protein H9L39_18298 [Fusarium oxysporum f. sp. albedinis]